MSRLVTALLSRGSRPRSTPAGGGRREPDAIIAAAVRDAAGGTSVQDMYCQVMAALGPRLVYERVLAVAEELARESAADTRTGQSASGPGESRRGTPDGALRDRLTRIAGDDATGRALELLLDPDLRDEAWSWLAGGYSSQRLAEHGVPGQISTGEQGLQALGAVTALCTSWPVHLAAPGSPPEPQPQEPDREP